jgi:hypothetical protein
MGGSTDGPAEPQFSREQMKRRDSERSKAGSEVVEIVAVRLVVGLIRRKRRNQNRQENPVSRGRSGGIRATVTWNDDDPNRIWRRKRLNCMGQQGPTWWHWTGLDRTGLEAGVSPRF